MAAQKEVAINRLAMAARRVGPAASLLLIATLATATWMATLHGVISY